MGPSRDSLIARRRRLDSRVEDVRVDWATLTTPACPMPSPEHWTLFTTYGSTGSNVPPSP
jgi:hypothetical protein